MSHYAIMTDLNRCVGCLSCSAACKTVNNVPIGSFWIKVLRVGPKKCGDYQGKRPNIETYFLPMQCQHCKGPRMREGVSHRGFAHRSRRYHPN